MDLGKLSDKDYYALVKKYRTYKEAGAAMGQSKDTVAHRMKRIKDRGYDPEKHLYHEQGGIVSGASSLYKYQDHEDGLVLQWIKTKAEDESAFKAVEEAFKSLADIIKPVKPVKRRKAQTEDLATVYTITDYHIGAYCWADETGDNWDVEIAQQVLINAMAEMIEGSPESELGIFAQLGDFLHFDGIEALTPTSGHVLDADTRYSRLVEVAISLVDNVIQMLMKKHNKVYIVICEGNHDIAGSVWLRKLIKARYAKEPRITVNDTEFPFYAYQHGDMMIAWHHGHKVKNKSLPAFFSSDPAFRKMWGDSRYTYIHTGHYHHIEQDKAEGGGAIVERHPTLAGRDAYAARGGYVSQRSTKAITYHKTRGKVREVEVQPTED